MYHLVPDIGYESQFSDRRISVVFLYPVLVLLISTSIDGV